MDDNTETLLSSTPKYTDDDAEKVQHIAVDIIIHVARCN